MSAKKTRRRRTLIALPPRMRVVLVVVIVLLVGVMATAVATTDRFYLSRILVWRDADFRDFTRFPSRAVPAGVQASPLGPPPAVRPEFLRMVRYRRDAPDPADARASMRTTLDDVGGSWTTEPLESFLADTGTTAFVVLARDALLYEGYFNGYDRTSTQTSFSTAKSFVSALIGIAIEEGYIGNVDDPIVDYLPELRGRGVDRITIRHLLTMSSGLRYFGEGGGGGPLGDDAKTYYDPDLRALALTVQAEIAPGTRWEYNNYHPLLLGIILERTTGRSVATYLSEKIWRPMGAEADGSWSLDSVDDGFEKMESGLNGHARDFARFGRLYLTEGAVDGREVVPSDWVAASTATDSTSDPADFYQYFWWTDVARPGRYLARGNLGQFIYVAPDKGLVIVRFGERWGYNHWPELLRAIADESQGQVRGDAPDCREDADCRAQHLGLTAKISG